MGQQIKRDIPVNQGFKTLLFFLLIYIFGSPFLSPYPSLAIVAHATLSITLFFSVYAVRKEKRQRTFAMTLLLPVLSLYWIGIYNIIPFSRTGSYLLLSIYLGLLVYFFITELKQATRVTLRLLVATLCLYLIIGLFWGALYALLYEINPAAYGGVLLDNMQGNKYTVFVYFSMVTLTTLGYGDITPQTHGATSLCQMEAIIGQFFTAVLVAWLVGNYISDKHSKE
ncbi:potassium channel family protein [Desulfopila sp. IMCC35008]|uniref:potassium channel family protein n=1 Tax=Desulfopila sp. IMCC35008 TaxID=2653858 RepID=UPI0013D7F350|nr:potassium channel family protein [Desulfopila sp. IMCC35008]